MFNAPLTGGASDVGSCAPVHVIAPLPFMVYALPIVLAPELSVIVPEGTAVPDTEEFVTEAAQVDNSPP
jgi:hypothetical protein